MVAGAFEKEDGVDHVFEGFGAGDVFGFGDVSDDENGDISGFCKSDELVGDFANLGGGAGGGIEVEGVEGLDGVENDEGGFLVGEGLEDGFESGFGEEVEILGEDF